MATTVAELGFRSESLIFRPEARVSMVGSTVPATQVCMCFKRHQHLGDEHCIR
ncbi:hypothetical protein HanRHA438_Chr11g0528391 [Helianthus annuus]|nr:hypothetical protein HanIR_Chr11g0555471 [Helianthus annuus]KAJ0872847.1 hypothetical protein HanRHA438_Chr11g0528391 [Helianthus annuus]KAJ0877255.1 hypothetical protein HanPSC8_Chr11g0497991 [Helianthus annuus]